YHGPVGLTRIASRIHRLAHAFAACADTAPGAEVLTWEFFDTVALRVADAEAARAVADRAGYNIRVIDSTTIGVSFGEPHTVADAHGLLEDLGIIARIDVEDFEAASARAFGPHAVPDPAFDAKFHRDTELLTHPVFSAHGSETAMMRYQRTLADRDLALDRSMIPLGSCPMELNAAVEAEPITRADFSSIHPF